MGMGGYNKAQRTAEDTMEWMTVDLEEKKGEDWWKKGEDREGQRKRRQGRKKTGRGKEERDEERGKEEDRGKRNHLLDWTT